jgi:CheY-like chemotaxis protein
MATPEGPHERSGLEQRTPTIPNAGMTEKNPAGRRVLIAFSEKVISDTLTHILKQCGYDAHAVYSGEEILARAPHFGPDLIISDVNMSGMTGIDAAIRIRDTMPSTEILLFSGQASTADLLEEASAQGYQFETYAMPIHPQDLLVKLGGPTEPLGGWRRPPEQARSDPRRRGAFRRAYDAALRFLRVSP